MLQLDRTLTRGFAAGGWMRYPAGASIFAVVTLVGTAKARNGLERKLCMDDSTGAVGAPCLFTTNPLHLTHTSLITENTQKAVFCSQFDTLPFFSHVFHFKQRLAVWIGQFPLIDWTEFIAKFPFSILPHHADLEEQSAEALVNSRLTRGPHLQHSPIIHLLHAPTNHPCRWARPSPYKARAHKTSLLLLMPCMENSMTRFFPQSLFISKKASRINNSKNIDWC